MRGVVWWWCCGPVCGRGYGEGGGGYWKERTAGGAAPLDAGCLGLLLCREYGLCVWVWSCLVCVHAAQQEADIFCSHTHHHPLRDPPSTPPPPPHAQDHADGAAGRMHPWLTPPLGPPSATPCHSHPPQGHAGGAAGRGGGCQRGAAEPGRARRRRLRHEPRPALTPLLRGASSRTRSLTRPLAHPLARSLCGSARGSERSRAPARLAACVCCAVRMLLARPAALHARSWDYHPQLEP